MNPSYPFAVIIFDSDNYERINWYDNQEEADQSAKMACEEGGCTAVYVMKLVSYATLTMTPFYKKDEEF